jgi:toxin ParE1/3/4
LPRALADRAAIARTIAKDSPKAARDQGDRIRSQTNNLRDHPEFGRSGRLSGTRELVVAGTSFLVIYRIRRQPQQIEILRVIHGAQRWPPKR